MGRSCLGNIIKDKSTLLQEYVGGVTKDWVIIILDSIVFQRKLNCFCMEHPYITVHGFTLVLH